VLLAKYIETFGRAGGATLGLMNSDAIGVAASTFYMKGMPRTLDSFRGMWKRCCGCCRKAGFCIELFAPQKNHEREACLGRSESDDDEMSEFHI
jgi:hypothetical protein